MIDFDLSACAQGSIRWDQFRLSSFVPAGIPGGLLPSGDTQVQFRLDIRPLATGGGTGGGLVAEDYGLSTQELSGKTVMLLCVIDHRLSQELSLWGLTIHPDVKVTFRFAFSTLDEATHALSESPGRISLVGSMDVEFRLRFPPLPDMPFIHFQSGDGDGWIAFRLTGEVQESLGGTPSVTVAVKVMNVATLGLGESSEHPTLLLALESITGSLTTNGVAATLQLDGSVRADFYRPELPDALRVISPLIYAVVPETMQASANFNLTINLSDSEDPSLELAVTAAVNTDTLDLFAIIFDVMSNTGRVMISAPDGAGDTDQKKTWSLRDRKDGKGNPAEALATLTPKSLTLKVRLKSDRPEVSVEGLASCTLLGESFDAELVMVLNNDQPVFGLQAGIHDPIRLSLDISDFASIWAGLAEDIKTVSAMYDLDKGLRAQLEKAVANVHEFLSLPDTGMGIAFDIRNLQVTLNPAAGQPLTLEGEIGLVRCPAFLGDALAGLMPTIVFGASDTSVYLALQMPADGSATRPLFTVELRKLLAEIKNLALSIPGPVGWNLPDLDNADIPDVKITVTLENFKFSYDWSTESVSVGVVGQAKLTSPNWNFNGSRIEFPLGHGDVRTFSINLAAGEANGMPIAQWDIRFGDPKDRRNRGLQAFLGSDSLHQTFVGLWLRHFEFAPVHMFGLTRFALSAGGAFGNVPKRRICPPSIRLVQDNPEGFALDPQNPSQVFLYNGYRVDLQGFLRGTDGRFVYEPDEPYKEIWADLEIQNLQVFGSMLWIAVGLALEESYGAGTAVMLLSGIVLPFIDEFRGTVNVPGVIEGEVLFEMPVPQLSIKAMLELAIIILKKFKVDKLPDESELFDIFYARLQGRLRLPLLENLFGESAGFIQGGLELHARLNAGELFNALMPMLATTVETVEKAAAQIQTGLNSAPPNPVAALGMIPQAWRRFELNSDDSRHRLLNFSFSGSLYMLTPDEMLEELTCYFENKRPKRKGLRGLPPLPWDRDAKFDQGILRPVSFKLSVPPVAVIPEEPPPRPNLSRPLETNHVYQRKWTVWRGFHPSALVWDDLVKDAARDFAAHLWICETIKPNAICPQKYLTDILDATRLHEKQVATELVNLLEDGKLDSQTARAKLIEKLQLPASTSRKLHKLFDDLLDGTSTWGDRQPGWKDKCIDRIVYLLHIRQKMTRGPVRPILNSTLASPALDGLPIQPSTRMSTRNVSGSRLAPPSEVAPSENYLRQFRSVADCPFDPAPTMALLDSAIAVKLTIKDKTQVGFPKESEYTSTKTTSLEPGITALRKKGEMARLPRLESQPDKIGWKHFVVILPDFVERIPTLAAFKVEVVDSAAAFTVISSPGGYYLLTTPMARIRSKPAHTLAIAKPAPRVKRTRLPDAFVSEALSRDASHAPESVLKSNLRIQGLETRTPGEKTKVQRVTAQDSLFARREYQINQLSGGSTQVSIAHMLRDSDTKAYMKPKGPVLLGGLSVNLFDSVSMQMCGLVVPDLAHPEQSDLFLYAAAKETLELGAFALTLEGCFWLVKGQDWTQPLRSYEDGAYFQGRVRLARNGETILAAHGNGSVTVQDDKRILTLELDLEWEIDWDIRTTISPPSLGRLWTVDANIPDHPPAAPAQLKMTLIVETNAREIKLSAAFKPGSKARIGYSLLTPEWVEKTITLIPETQICVWLPPIPFQPGKMECHTIPAVQATIQVPTGRVDSSPPEYLTLPMPENRFDLTAEWPLRIRIPLPDPLSGIGWEDLVLPDFLETKG